MPNTISNEFLIYTRRSTDDAEHQKNSIDYQIDHCRRFAAHRNFPIADLTTAGFVTNGVIAERHTAFKTAQLEISKDGNVRYHIERPKFQQLVALLAQRKLRGVIALCWDRLSRNPHDDAVIKDLRARGLEVIFVLATYDDTSSGALHMDIDGMFAAHHSRVTSEKIRAVYAKLRAEGKCTYRAPIGYLDKGPARKPLDPQRAPIVRRIFEMYATGRWSFSELTTWANKQGLTTKPLRRSRTREEILSGHDNLLEQVSKPVNIKTIEKILHNPFYAGYLKYDGATIPGKHEPLVSRSLFERVQVALTGRTTSLRYTDNLFFTYRGLARCVCGRLFTPYAKKGFTYYRPNCRDACDADRPNLSEPEIDAIFDQVLKQIALTPEEVADLKAGAPDAFKQLREEQDQKSLDRDREHQRLAQDREYLVKNKITFLREGVYTMETFTAAEAKLERDLAALEGASATTAVVNAERKLARLLSLSELALLAQQSLNHAKQRDRRELAISVVSELVLRGPSVAEVRAKSGFDVLLRRHVASSGRVKFLISELTRA